MPLLLRCQLCLCSGRFGLVPYVGLLHGGVLLFALALIAIRHNRWALANLWRGRGMAA